jgi:hypothetical protein
MHRFNTAQRESSQADSRDYYNTYVYDEIYFDDYDASGNFQICAYTEDKANEKYEGYYYNPHYEIRLKTFDKIQTVFPDFLTIRSFTSVENDTNIYRITTLENHYLTLGDKSVIYDMSHDEYYYCTTISSTTSTYKTYTCKIYDEHGKEVKGLTEVYNSDDNARNYKLFKMDNLGCPNYARVLRDGTYRIIWRDVINNGVDENNNGGIEVYPFTNGAFYINRRVDIYVRRQDPYGFYGLRSEDDIFGAERDIDEENNYARLDEIQC